MPIQCENNSKNFHFGKKTPQLKDISIDTDRHTNEYTPFKNVSAFRFTIFNSFR